MHWSIQSILISVSLSMDAFAVSLSNGLTNKKMPVRYMIVTALFFGLFQGAMPLIGYLLGSIFEEWISVALPIIGFAVLSFLGIKMIVDSAKDIRNEKKERQALLEAYSGEGDGSTTDTDNMMTDGGLTVATTEEIVTDGGFSFTTTEENATDGDTIVATADVDEADNADCNTVASKDNQSLAIEEDKPFKFSWKMLLIQSIATSIDALTVGLVYIGKDVVEVYVTFALIAVITFGICVWGVFFGKKFGEKLKNKAGIFGGVILIGLALKTIIEFLVERFA